LAYNVEYGKEAQKILKKLIRNVLSNGLGKESMVVTIQDYGVRYCLVSFLDYGNIELVISD
jgi:hypothetical protein